MRIIVDAMGGDNAPQAPVRGAIQAAKECGVEIILVGRGEDILKVLHEDGIADLPAGVEIAHAEQVVDMCDGCLEIPQFGTKHSMNVSVTAGMVIWTIFARSLPGARCAR